MNITEIIVAVLGFCTAIVTYFLAPLLRSRIAAEDFAAMQKWVNVFVAAAEQIFDASATAEKKAYVIARLADKGYTIDSTDVDEAIEAAVLALHAAIYGGDSK